MVEQNRKKDKIRHILKYSLFSLVIFLLSLLFWSKLRSVFLWRDGRIVIDIVQTFLIFSIFFILLIIYLFLFENKITVLITMSFISFSILFFFLKENGEWASKSEVAAFTIYSFVLFGILYYTNHTYKKIKKNTIDIHVFDILKSSHILLIVFILLFSILFYLNFPFLDEEKEFDFDSALAYYIFGSNLLFEVKDGDIVLNQNFFKAAIERFSNWFSDTNVQPPISMDQLDWNIKSYITYNYIDGFLEEKDKPLVTIDDFPYEMEIYIKNYLGDIDFYTENGRFKYWVLDKELGLREYIKENIDIIASLTDQAVMEEYIDDYRNEWEINITEEDIVYDISYEFINKSFQDIFPIKLKPLFIVFPSLTIITILQFILLELSLNIIYPFILSLILFIMLKARFFSYKKVNIEKNNIIL